MKSTIAIVIFWAIISVATGEEPAPQATEYKDQLRVSVAAATHYLVIQGVRGGVEGKRLSLFGVKEPLSEIGRKELLANNWEWKPEKKNWEESDTILVFLKDGIPTSALRIPFSSGPSGNAVFGLTFETKPRDIIVQSQVSDHGNRLIIPNLRKIFPALFKPR